MTRAQRPDGTREAAREDPEARFVAFFEGSLTAMLLADDHRRYVDANPAACELLGCSREQLVGRRIDDLTPPQARAGLAEQWNALLRNGSQAGCCELTRPDGSPLEVEFSASAEVLPGRHLWILVAPPARRPAGAASDDLGATRPTDAAEAPDGSRAPLTAREREVLALLAMGLSGAEIAERLFISPATVRTHIGNSMEKLGAKTRAHAIALAFRRGAIAF